MKISIISSSASSLHDMRNVLQSESHTVAINETNISRMRAIADEQAPDLLLLETMRIDATELAQVGDVTTRHPELAVILACGAQTPEFLLNAMRAGVREVLPSPPPIAALRSAVERVAAKMTGIHSQRLGKVLAFVPCKGGSGATFLATNLGYQLAETNAVLLIDLNLQFGDALSFVNDSKPASTLANVAHDIRRLDASFLAASSVRITPSYSILAAPEEPSQATEIKPDHIEAILVLAVTQYDFVLLDVGRVLDPLSIKALDHAYRIFPVLQASLPDLRNAKKLMAVFASLGYSKEKSELIVNRFDKRSEIGLDDMRRSLDGYKLRTVPNSYREVTTSINHGSALIRTAGSNAVTKHLTELTLSLLPRQEEARSLISRWFKRA